MKTLVVSLLLSPLAFAQPATDTRCRNTHFPGDHLVPWCEVREQWVPFSGETLTVTLDGSGSIRVLGSDEPGAQIRAEVATAAARTAEAQALAAEVSVDTTSPGVVLGRGPRAQVERMWSILLEIRVPRGSALVLKAINGSVTVEGQEGPVRASTMNGSVKLVRVSGDVFGRTLNGSVSLQADRWRGQAIDIQTKNGRVEAELPKDTAARVELKTVNGRILTGGVDAAAVQPSKPSSTPSWPFRDDWQDWFAGVRGKSLSFDLGGGGSSVRAETTNGEVRFWLAGSSISE